MELTMIFMDTRGASGITKDMFKKEKCVLTVLKSADFTFMGKGNDDEFVKIGIEHKTVPGFVYSILNNNLAGHQILKMKSHYHYSYLIIQGNWKMSKTGELLCQGSYKSSTHKKHVENSENDNAVRGASLVPQRKNNRNGWYSLKKRIGDEKGVKSFNRVNEKFFLGAVNSISVLGGVFVVFTSSPGQTVTFIETLYHWWNKCGMDEHTLLHKTKHSPKTTTINYLRKLCDFLPGVSKAAARKLCRNFTSIADMVTADDNRWNEIDGISADIKAKCRQALHEDCFGTEHLSGVVLRKKETR